MQDTKVSKTEESSLVENDSVTPSWILLMAVIVIAAVFVVAVAVQPHQHPTYSICAVAHPPRMRIIFTGSCNQAAQYAMKHGGMLWGWP